MLMYTHMTRTLQFGAIIAAIFITACALAYLLIPKQSFGAAGTLPASIYSTNLIVASTTPGIVNATSTACAARVVQTASSSVMIQFTEAFGGTPGPANGIYQGASTTVAYDSNIYGCGAMRIYSFATQQMEVLQAN